jgi:hypothetical protein
MADVGTLLQFDGKALEADFGRMGFIIHHRLAEHPLFQLERLVALSQRLPRDSVEYNAGNIPTNQDPTQTPQTGLSIEETVRRIKDANSWMVLKNVEQDPEYQALLGRCLDEIRPHSDVVDPGMTRREGFIFLSSPGAVTPFHMDPEQNFLLQIAGRKWVHQWDRGDRVAISEDALERFFAFATHRNLPHQESLEARARVFELRPGQGLHFPPLAPHWVKNGEEPSISFSITFRTDRSRQAAGVYTINQLLRRYRLSPRPPERSKVVDHAKYLAFRVLNRIRKRGGGPRY